MFRVFVVKSGEMFGLLLERQDLPGTAARRAFFFLDRPWGLRPNRDIHVACSGECYALPGNRYHEKILKELRAYAEAAAATGDMHAIRPLSEKYSEVGGYTRLVQHFFERVDSPLRRFVGDYHDFKEKVLGRPHGQDKVVGMAEEFGVLSPEDVMPEDHLEYLAPIERVLRIGDGVEPAWFRKSGPIAADFDKVMVFRREETLRDLRNLVLGNRHSVLEGQPATGKTVLIRNLLYNLHGEGHHNLYHFGYRQFDIDRLAYAINSVRGVVVLEDIHRDIQAFQQLYPLLKHNPDRQVLFTARSHWRDLLQSPDEDMGRLPALSLEPFKDVDGIIGHFISQHPAIQWPSDIIESIKGASGKSFWLLAYALQGCVKNSGKGECKDWVQAGVKGDLKYLACLLGQRAPEVLVALSPLYSHELLTSERYLVVMFGCNIVCMLGDLVSLGEITQEETMEGEIFYGLPHSALAHAYWEHGKSYRIRLGLGSSEDFICDYASANTPNGLQAVAKLKGGERGQLLARLAKGNQLGGAIERELSLRAISVLAETCESPIISRLVEHLPRKFELSGDVWGMGKCIKALYLKSEAAGRRLWQSLDKPMLAAKLSRGVSGEAVSRCMLDIRGASAPAWAELCRLLDIEGLAATMSSMTNVYLLYEIGVGISCVAPALAENLYAKLSLHALAGSVNSSTAIDQIGYMIMHVFHTDENLGWALWRNIDKESLSQKIAVCSDYLAVGQCIRSVFAGNEAAGRELWSTVDVEGLAEALSSGPDLDEKAACVFWIGFGNKSAGLDLRSLITNAELNRKVGELRRCPLRLLRATGKW